jgi:hypothetical protein
MKPKKYDTRGIKNMAVCALPPALTRELAKALRVKPQDHISDQSVNIGDNLCQFVSKVLGIKDGHPKLPVMSVFDVTGHTVSHMDTNCALLQIDKVRRSDSVSLFTSRAAWKGEQDVTCMFVYDRYGPLCLSQELSAKVENCCLCAVRLQQVKYPSLHICMKLYSVVTDAFYTKWMSELVAAITDAPDTIISVVIYGNNAISATDNTVHLTPSSIITQLQAKASDKTWKVLSDHKSYTEQAGSITCFFLQFEISKSTPA